ncbi:hypothetical protein S7711_02035 [Stachybotrys chartarum IBT 7711]|uniref:Anaphase-promoting complex subunit 4 WD40 domain-containing protein n=1 Tax=Stachybotrys chartarum (strain CBS 109288 / IBT 7711) TaxID=1280523 RepID=A0A084AW19_STACB|nr:hypothetical protein S7711_02035 [Stachybotrys chartarum IBT 7711]
MLSPPTTIHRSNRRASRAYQDIPSPADSGYYSNDDGSPKTQTRTVDVYLPSFDGSGSSASLESCSDAQDLEAVYRASDPFTSRARLASSENRIASEQTVTRDNAAGVESPQPPSRQCPNKPRKPRTPDRFVPQREKGSTSTERYHVTKHPESLSSSERVLRYSHAKADPFMPRRQREPSTSPGSPSRPRRPFHSLHGVRQISGGRTFDQERRQAGRGGFLPSGILAAGPQTVDDGRGRLLRSGTNARVFTSALSERRSSFHEEWENYQDRIAKALKLDRIRRVLKFDIPPSVPRRLASPMAWCTLDGVSTVWNGYRWTNAGKIRGTLQVPGRRSPPTAPFKVLDAPNLRDDFYCSVLAYCYTCQILAVGLGNVLYTWSEDVGVRTMHGLPTEGVWLTSVAFSSEQGGRSVLAMGRSNGTLIIKSLYDSLPRFEVQQPYPVACVSWRPTSTPRPSKAPLAPDVSVTTEDLVVGDDTGTLYYYVVEWPMNWEVARDTWPGSMTLVAKVSLHTQQICGLAWSPDGKQLATGGNDNLCCLLEVDDILDDDRNVPNDNDQGEYRQDRLESALGLAGFPFDSDSDTWRRPTAGYINNWGSNENSQARGVSQAARGAFRRLGSGCARYRWMHGAAVKAIAFCPWRNGLIATGGGSNDKSIHFFHTTSGSALATIAVSAQVTSLIWSTTSREIVATFGYAQPEHPYRIAIFSWPGCRQVAAIPWEGDLRALYAIPYPGGPAEDVVGGPRKGQEGCIVVASSDRSVKFHEVWSSGQKATVGGAGTLAGSDILELLEGIDKDGDVIR